MNTRRYYFIDLTRLLLLPFACIFEFGGFQGKIFTLLRLIFGAAPIAYFILSGYVVLKQDENADERLRYEIKRMAIMFGILCAVYFAISAVYGAIVGESVFPLLASPSMWFDFLVLNIWPFKFGTTIWFVQSMLYAYIIIYLLRKIKLMRFDVIIAIVCLIFGFLSGEVSSIIGFNLAGHASLPANFITQALPYMIIGDIIHRNMHSLFYMPVLLPLAGCFAGIALIAIEATTLSNTNMFTYSEHLIGMGVLAISIVIIASSYRPASIYASDFFAISSNLMFRIIYYIAQPISVLFVLVAGKMSENVSSLSTLGNYSGIVAFAASFVLSVVVSAIYKAIIDNKIIYGEPNEQNELNDSNITE